MHVHMIQGVFTLRHETWSSLFIFMPDTLVVLNDCCFALGFFCFPISYFTEACYVLMFRPCQFYKRVVWSLVVWDHVSTSTYGLLSHQGITHNISLIMRTACFEGCCYQVMLLQKLTISYKGVAQSVGLWYDFLAEWNNFEFWMIIWWKMTFRTLNIMMN